MNNKGFTLVEIIAVILILGLLAVITTPAYNSISTNIKTRNYESKKNTIESQTLSYVERYLKDKVYDGNTTDVAGNLISKKYCFKVEYLIQNGIINSDSEKEEYIKNDLDNELYGDIDDDENYKTAYVLVLYNNESFKLSAEFTVGDPSDVTSGCDEIFEGV